MKLTFAPLLLLLGACGDRNDSILTGFSGVVIFVLLIWAFFHYTRRKS